MVTREYWGGGDWLLFSKCVVGGHPNLKCSQMGGLEQSVNYIGKLICSNRACKKIQIALVALKIPSPHMVHLKMG